MNRKNLLRWGLVSIIFFISIAFFRLVNWTNTYFSALSVDQIVFHLKVPLQGTDKTTFASIQETVLYPSLRDVSFFLILLTAIKITKRKLLLNFEYRKNRGSMIKLKLVLWPFPHYVAIALAGSTILLLIGIMQANAYFGLFVYIKAQIQSSGFIAENYVIPSEELLKFPALKRNLIYIYVESMENTFADLNTEGAYTENYIPELSKLAGDNVNFSNTASLGGFHPVTGTQWTMAGMFSQSTGLPLKLAIDGNAMSDYNEFFPGITSIGDILERNGYKNMLLLGSDATFGGRRSFYTQHGNYEIVDYQSAKEKEWIPEDYLEWWGYEDQKLFEFAKIQLEELSKQNQPFNFTMLTADSHHEDGYVCKLCNNTFKIQYANVLACSSRQVENFIQWIKVQDFYDNTTIIVVGDHITMDSDFAAEIESSYDRTIYNSFINVPLYVPFEHTKNRNFSSLDLFPTTLSSLGVRIEGNQLALGVDLFSDQETLLEEYGPDFSFELSLNSKFYNDEFIFKEN